MKQFPSLVGRAMPQPWNRHLSTALVVWLVALVATQAPLFLSAPEPSESAYRQVVELRAIVSAATVVFGFAIGWASRVRSIVRCAVYGALVLTTTQFLLTNWVPSGGEPIFPMPINFLIALVINGIVTAVLLGLGALAGAGAHRWARHRTADRVT